jgi:hypothetical protein
MQCRRISDPMKFASDNKAIGLIPYGVEYSIAQGTRWYDSVNFTSDGHAIGPMPLWIQISDPYGEG